MSVPLWIVGLTAIVFAAGIATGLFLASLLTANETDRTRLLRSDDEREGLLP